MKCDYCPGDADDYYVLHHFPVDALWAIHDYPHDPIVRHVGNRQEGCDILLKWLKDNEWKIIPPDA
jgi:hypothetical protein